MAKEICLNKKEIREGKFEHQEEIKNNRKRKLWVNTYEILWTEWK